jgi:hypothetical protein
VNEQVPASKSESFAAVLRCVMTSVRLLSRRRIEMPHQMQGVQLRFSNGTEATVYRETTVAERSLAPCVLVVTFKLRWLRGEGHRLFRWESLLNTPLFVGFPGFVSKLWLTADEDGQYRGIYDWDGVARAEHYARCLWRVLALVSVAGTIRYHAIPGLTREQFLAGDLDGHDDPAAGSWWRVTEEVPYRSGSHNSAVRSIRLDE